MSSDGVIADPNDVRRLAKELQRFETEMLQLIKSAHKAIDRANWHDRQKEKFVAQFRDFERQNQRFVNERTKQFVASLNGLASDLERAQSRRF
jgi:sugar diacid utilization regulator